MPPEYSNYSEYQENEIQEAKDQSTYPLDSLEGMDPNSTLPPVGYRSEETPSEPKLQNPIRQSVEHLETTSVIASLPAQAGASEAISNPTAIESPKPMKSRHLIKTLILSAAILSAVILLIYVIILRQKALELENTRKDLKSSLEKLSLSFAAINTDLNTLSLKNDNGGSPIIDRLTNLEKTSFLGKTEAIRATQILGSINEILKRPAATITVASTSDVFDRSRIFTLNAENYTSEVYKTFSYFNLTYSTDVHLANVSIILSEIINEALTGSDVDPSKFKEITDTLQKVKDALTEAGKDIPYALGTVAEKNLMLIDGFTAAVKSTKNAVDTGDRLTLSTIIGTTGEKLNALWQSRSVDEQAFWETNRTLKRYLYLKSDTDKILKLL